MLERYTPILRVVCYVLGALILIQVSRLLIQKDPLDSLALPPPLVLAAKTNSPATSKATNSVAASDQANTNASSAVSTNTITASSPKTNSTASTNASSTAPTNAIFAASAEKKSTNAPSSKDMAKGATNSVSGPASAKKSSRPSGPGGGPTSSTLPPAVQARVDKIIQSEILGAIPRPMPMALLGIAGKDVFLRAPNGQTGMIREGEELGGVKLLRVAPNRVLVEHEKQQKELTIFSGFGSETLLSKEKDISK
jgi:hypothetical protein